MTEKFIQKALFLKFDSHKYRFTNLYYFQNESDWLSFLPSGFCYEIEIKVSRNDFFADFKKQRHVTYSQNDTGSKYFIKRHGVERMSNPSWELTKEYPELVESREYRRYRHRTDQEYFDINIWMDISTHIDICKIEHQNLPNKFFYAVPEGMIKKDEIPEYAGLIYITEDMRVLKVKDGKFIHKEKLSPEKVFNKTYYVYEDSLREKLLKQ